LFMEAIDRADSEKGEKTLLTINITDSVPKLFENAERALEQEKISANAAGIQAILYLAEGDMRAAINLLQASASAGETVDDKVVFAMS
jgi:Ribulose 1,5-bisphosphate carboxylase, large subunit